MESYIFSAEKNAFYPVSLQELYEIAGSWPDDGVEVSQEIFLEFSGIAPEGKQRGIKAGLPAWVDVPPLTKDEYISIASAEKQSKIDYANSFMNGKQWPGKAAIGRLKGDDLAQYNAWLDYLDALEAIDTSSAPDIEWPTAPDQ